MFLKMFFCGRCRFGLSLFFFQKIEFDQIP
uniref:Uncharacterized protein n=1 Tax=Anguilla anguilla TaxID=7936 RepID=A0A0E9RZG0_ANGAN